MRFHFVIGIIVWASTCVVLGAQCSDGTAENALIRLGLEVGEGKVDDFEKFYDETLLPILQSYGAVAHPEMGRPTHPAYFSRLFEVDCPAQIRKLKNDLAGDKNWQRAMVEFGKVFSASGAEAVPLPYHVDLYYAKNDSGQKVPHLIEEGYWTIYTERDGLPKGLVRAVIQDAKGYIWAAIDGGGVVRFNGQTFEQYTIEDGLVDNNAQGIVEDDEGNMWVGTSNGVSRYDGEQWTTIKKEDGLCNNDIWTIYKGRDGDLFFASPSGGICHYEDGVWDLISQEDGIGLNSTASVYQERNGSLWVGTFGGGLSQYDGEAWRTYTVQDGLLQNNIMSLYGDTSGDMWVGTWTQGLNRFDGEKWHSYTAPEGLVSNGVRSIAEDANGSLWFGQDTGISRFDPIANAWDQFLYVDGVSLSVTHSILLDRSGDLWFSTGNGLVRYSQQNVLTLVPQDGAIKLGDASGLLIDKQDDIWFNIAEGVIRHSEEESTVFDYRHGLIDSKVSNIYQDRDGGIWFGTWVSGVSHFDGVAWTTYSVVDGLPYNSVRAILQDREGAMWFATYGGGVGRYDGKDWKRHTTEDGLGDNSIMSMIVDANGDIWFGQSLGGVSRFDGESIETLFEDQTLINVISMYSDDKEWLWLGTVYGLYCYDGEHWRHFGVEDGLSGNWVLGITQDHRGRYIFSTSTGLSLFNGEVFQTLDYRDGLVEGLFISTVEDRHGSLWIGSSSDGLAKYEPVIGDGPSISIEGVISDRRYENVQALDITTPVGLLVIEYVAVDFKTRPEAIIYRYRLRGYDDEWKQTHQRRVEYEDLPVGTYVFEVVAIDRDLNYSETPATLGLSVNRPYERIAMYAIVCIALVIAFFASMRSVRSRRKEMQIQADLMVAVEERNLALQEANTRLQEADQLKSDFVANVSHELRTPLTVIKSSVDNMLDGITGPLNEGQDLYLDRLRVHANRLTRLINDLLDLSRIEAGHLQLDRTRVSVARIAHNVVDHLQVLATEEKVELVCHVRGADREIAVDPDRVYQIFVNLVNNALKFTPPGGQVAVEVETKESEVQVWVRDTGPGIAEEELQQVFEKFHQVGFRGRHGAGIGLSIVRHLVDLHEGRVWVESEEGKGSAFIFILPAGE